MSARRLSIGAAVAATVLAVSYTPAQAAETGATIPDPQVPSSLYPLMSDGNRTLGASTQPTQQQLRDMRKYDAQLWAYAKQKASQELVSRAWEEPTVGQFYVGMNFSSGPIGGGVGHAAIISRNPAWTVESYSRDYAPTGYDGVAYYARSKWFNKKNVYRLAPNGVGASNYWLAGQQAEGYVTRPYNHNYMWKYDTGSFYCSSLVWRAWNDNGHTLVNAVENRLPYVSPAMLTHGNVRWLEVS